MIVSHKKEKIGSLIPNVIVFGGGVFGRWLVNGLSALIQGIWESFLTPSCEDILKVMLENMWAKRFI